MPIPWHEECILRCARQARPVAGAATCVGSVLALPAHPPWALVPLLLGTRYLVAAGREISAVESLLIRLPFNQARLEQPRATVEALASGRPMSVA